MDQAEFRDRRLVEAYDAEFGWSRADDAFLSLAARAPMARVLDLGCGTGRLAIALARGGHTVTGVDPAPASLERARSKVGADRVTWVEGTSADVPSAAFDVALMTGNVAQLFVADDEWHATLADLRRAVVPGGVLAFDTRDPAARAWERWNEAFTRRAVRVATGVVSVWTEVLWVDGGVVAYARHFEFDDGTTLRSRAVLRFRTETEVRRSLAAAGFRTEDVRRPPPRGGGGDAVFLVVARR